MPDAAPLTRLQPTNAVRPRAILGRVCTIALITPACSRVLSDPYADSGARTALLWGRPILISYTNYNHADSTIREGLAS